MAHIPMPCQEGRSEALISDHDATNTAVIFVHGFKGHFQKTWQAFQTMVDDADESPVWRNRDLFFYSYDAENQHPDDSVLDFAQFVQSVFPNPPETLFYVTTTELDWVGKTPGDRPDQWLAWREPPYRYDSLWLVGHSLGGAVIRRYVANEFKSESFEAPGPRSSPAAAAKVVLFAPAHLGFQPSGEKALAYHTAEHVMGRVLTGVMSRYRAYPHLQRGSDFLQQLRRETEQMAERLPACAGLRPLLIWGKLEDVLIPGRFDTDHAASRPYEPNKGHIDICKPSLEYPKPMFFISGEKAQNAG